MALVVVAGIAGSLLALGWVGPDIDVWYSAGLLHALRERPLAPESLGYVPKLGQLVLLSPLIALGPAPDRWLAVVGILSLAFLFFAHASWARAAHLEVPLVILALALMPLVWRALDGGSVAWGWACVLLALRQRSDQTGRTTAWLAIGALFRPEVVGVGLALGIYGAFHRHRHAWRLTVAPLLAGLVGTSSIDLFWTGRLGSSSIAHAVFELARLEQVRGRWGFLDSAHPWLQLSIPLILVAAASLVRSRARSDGVAGQNAWLGRLIAGATGFTAVTAVNVAIGGTLFVRFLLPWASVVAAGAVIAPLPVEKWRRFAVLALIVLLGVAAWPIAARDFVGTYPSADSLLLARQLAKQTAPELVVSMDAGARAVSLGSGARPWKTTPWILESDETLCQSQVILARGAFLRRIGPPMQRCGPWRELVMDSAQVRLDLHVLLARRAK